MRNLLALVGLAVVGFAGREGHCPIRGTGRDARSRRAGAKFHAQSAYAGWSDCAGSPDCTIHSACATTFQAWPDHADPAEVSSTSPYEPGQKGRVRHFLREPSHFRAHLPNPAFAVLACRNFNIRILI